MASIYTQKNSPHYWIRYYDKLDPDPAKRRKSINTKIEISSADQKRIDEATKKGTKVKLQGNPEVKKLLQAFNTGLAERYIQSKTGVKLIKKHTLKEGFEEFKVQRSVPGSKKFLKPKTLYNYELAVDHLIKCCGNKQIFKYTKKDFNALLFYFDEIEIPGKTKRDKNNNIIEQETKSLSQNSRSIYSRSLHSLWGYFVSQKYAHENIIESLEPEEKDPAPIPIYDMLEILKYLKEETKYPHQYWIVKFMLLTGCRPSSAIVQLKEDIDFRGKKITIRNIKAGERKKKNYYRFPLYKELENLLLEMGVKHGDSDRLFYMYAIVPSSYTSPLSFFERAIKHLQKKKRIENYYTLKQIRPTLASYLVNQLKMDIFTVKKLLDHADIKITDKHYVDYNVNVARKELDVIAL